MKKSNKTNLVVLARQLRIDWSHQHVAVRVGFAHVCEQEAVASDDDVSDSALLTRRCNGASQRLQIKTFAAEI